MQQAEVSRGPQDLRGSARQVSGRPPAQRLHRASRTPARTTSPRRSSYMKIASERIPTNAEMKLVLADLMMEKGDKAAALDIMKSIDLTKIKNPLPLINGVDLPDQRRQDRRGARDPEQGRGAVPDPGGGLLLSRPRLRRGEEVSGGQGRPGEVRLDGGARRARAAGREEDPRADQGRQVAPPTGAWRDDFLHAVAAFGGRRSCSRPAEADPDAGGYAGRRPLESGTGSTQNPCTTASDEAGAATSPVAPLPPLSHQPSATSSIRRSRYRVLDALWLHQQRAPGPADGPPVRRNDRPPMSATSPSSRTRAT